MTKRQDNVFGQYLKNSFLIIYFLVFSIGLITILNMISISLTDPSRIDSLNRWVINFWYPGKPSEITHYVSCVIGMALYYLIYYRLASNNKIIDNKLKDNISATASIISILSIGLVINIILAVNIRPGMHNILPRAIIWVATFMLPFVANIKNISEQINNILSRVSRTRISITMLLLVIINLVYLIYPFVFEKLKIMNEFWDIPEKTLIGNKVIVNNKYINENILLGNCLKYDIDDNWVSANAKPVETNGYNSLVSSNALYDDNNALRLVGSIDNIVNSYNDEYHRDGLRRLYLGWKQYGYEESKTKEMDEFLKKNSYEIHWQILNRYWIHHHNHVLGPVNEINLGKDIKKVYMQYGWLNTVVLKTIMNRMGGVNYQNYSKLMYSFYYIYYALFIALMFLVLRKTIYVLPTIMLMTAGLNMVSYPFMYIAPGINPVRHLFDIFVIGLFFIYMKNQGKILNKICLVLSLLSAIIGIFNNSHVGLFALISLIAALAVKNVMDWKQKCCYEIFIMIMGVILGVYALMQSNIGAQYMTEYFKKGLLGFKTPDYVPTMIFLVVGLCYVMLMKQYMIKNELKHVCVLLLVYSQGLLAYYVWGSDMNHFIVFSPIFVFTIIAIVKLIVDNHKISGIKLTYVHAAILLISLMIYVPSVNGFVKNKRKFEEIFKTHITYQWNLPTANFISTMNPYYFMDSIKLIQKYNEKNEIYIISKYDSFLPFLAGKYSAMPFFDVSWYLITDKEIKECINSILLDKPRVLFVDTDIDRSYQSDIVGKWSPFGGLYDESLWRYQRLNLLKSIYNAVKEQYEPVEKAMLITAYERKKQD